MANGVGASARLAGPSSAKEKERKRAALTALQVQKTRLCDKHRRGFCSAGDQCPFAHGHEELRERPDLRRTRFCEALKGGNCVDQRCGFAHSLDELRVSAGVFKTQLCKWFIRKGVCNKGDNCRHAHGMSELRPSMQPSGEDDQKPAETSAAWADPHPPMPATPTRQAAPQDADSAFSAAMVSTCHAAVSAPGTADDVRLRSPVPPSPASRRRRASGWTTPTPATPQTPSTSGARLVTPQRPARGAHRGGSSLTPPKQKSRQQLELERARAPSPFGEKSPWKLAMSEAMRPRTTRSPWCSSALAPAEFAEANILASPTMSVCQDSTRSPSSSSSADGGRAAASFPVPCQKRWTRSVPEMPFTREFPSQQLAGNLHTSERSSSARSPVVSKGSSGVATGGIDLAALSPRSTVSRRPFATSAHVGEHAASEEQTVGTSILLAHLPSQRRLSLPVTSIAGDVKEDFPLASSCSLTSAAAAAAAAPEAVKVRLDHRIPRARCSATGADEEEVAAHPSSTAAAVFQDKQASPGDGAELSTLTASQLANLQLAFAHAVCPLSLLSVNHDDTMPLRRLGLLRWQAS
eukprot:TRINITY_DN10485_c0_g1_i1.p1 TRINITY_DN10485_c0_g1~~TRINITY_DN10485_c0_g1_i1.p1  ORF type:complete len:579 (+),score=77.20 TRINITY_DN10485_c0_g1_i1:80-1816(+)